MALDPVKNFAKVNVSIGYDAAATSIILASGHGAKLPQPSTDGAFNLVWWNITDYFNPSADPNAEIIRVTARTSDTLTVTRAQEGTTATVKNLSAKSYSMMLSVTAKMINDINSIIGGLQGQNLNVPITIPQGGTGAINAAGVKTNLNLDQVENIKLSTWIGTNNISVVGTVNTGTWQGTPIGLAYGGTGAVSRAASQIALGISSQQQRIINVVFDCGAVGDGVTDCTTAINTAISLIPTRPSGGTYGGIIYFPPGIYKTTGNFNLTARDGLQIIGSGVGTTIIDIAHSTNNLFITTGDVTNNLCFAYFTVTSSVTRTAGWVLNVNAPNNLGYHLKKSSLENIEIQKQVNGIWISQYEVVVLRNITAWKWVGSGGIGIKFGQTSPTTQGADALCDNIHIFGNSLSGDIPILDYGIWIEDCDAVNISNSDISAVKQNTLRIVGGQFKVRNCFFINTSFDTTLYGDSVLITGTTFESSKFTGCWFVGAGALSATWGPLVAVSGLKINTSIGVSNIIITGCNFQITTGTGLYVDTSNAGFTLTGCVFGSTGTSNVTGQKDGIYINFTLNNLGPIISGNMIVSNTTGKAIVTSSTSNRMIIANNHLLFGVTLGITPFVYANNNLS